MTRFVLDASFALTWIMESERSPATSKYFDILLDRIGEALVPPFWTEEMANVLLTAERSKRLTTMQVSDWVNALGSLPILVVPTTVHVSLRDIRLLARTHKLTSYDASYLYLAVNEGVALATRDKEISAAAVRVGVKLAN